MLYNITPNKYLELISQNLPFSCSLPAYHLAITIPLTASMNSDILDAINK